MPMKSSVSFAFRSWRRQYCFILDAVVIGVGVGEEKGGGEKNHPKIPIKKMLSPGCQSEGS